MQHEADKDIRSTVARVAGALVGLALVLGIIAPFDGIPPRPGTDELAPAKIEVNAVATGVFNIVPVGKVLPETAFPAPGERGGPTLKLKIYNISPIPLRLSVRLVGITPTLSEAVKVRSSAAGTVIINAPLGKSADWSRLSGVLRPGQGTTLRMRFKLLDLPPSEWRGRVDVRQLEFRGLRVDGTAIDQRPPVATTTPDEPAGTNPFTTTPSRTTPPVPTPQHGPPAPGTDTVMGAVVESATSAGPQNSNIQPPPSTPAGTSP